jgi:adenylate cyclase class 2
VDELPLEIEAKFAVAGLAPIRQRLLGLSARQHLPRLRETNLRFDFPDRRLQRAGQVLRVRSNHDGRLTFKAPGVDPEHRQELEVGIDDPQAARRLLESLGLQVVFAYEKYRETFTLDDCEVMLDELPFGSFVEIEGPHLGAVRHAAGGLGLDWEARLALTYLSLFEVLRQRHGWSFRDATFSDFEGVLPLPLEELMAALQAR